MGLGQKNILEPQYSENRYLKAHRRTHTGEKPFECSFCNQKFRHREALKRHESLHKNEKPFECKLCQIRFSHNADLRRHERSFHKRPKLKCTWDRCISTFNSYSDRIRHIRKKHDPTPFHCNECNRKYEFKKDLDHHKRKHQIIKTRKLYQK